MRVPQGITLIELLVYLGIVISLLLGITMFLVRFHGFQRTSEGEVALAQRMSSVLLQLDHVLLEAEAIDITNSTLGSHPSVLQFEDGDGDVVVIDHVEDGVVLGEQLRTLGRLRFQEGTQDAVWLTGLSMDVESWQVEAVRNSSSALTGLRITITARTLGTEAGTTATETFSATSTFDLYPHTIEL